ncbi:hypothetical protein [Paenibacillus durus]|uniref:Uncharacterized protein n=1 Tax=Paenibacillus durus ATCC 35681 TaxID=1333534 RepID=A0A0F7FAG7_PAEDU|nr:hypothetical protein [Paenibacillus durus]AKG35662.1 hypothetical protein VK70_14670 [Paenibacillus durus ATCC 35681]
MKNVVKKALMCVVMFAMIGSVSTSLVHASSIEQTENEQLQTVSDKANEKINKLDAEINALEQKEMEKARKETEGKSAEEIEQIINTFKAEIEEKTIKIQSKYGFEPVPNSAPDFTPMVGSDNISLSDGLTYDSSTGVYCFTGSWNWVDNQYDLTVDLEDLAAVRMTNPTGYLITKSYAKTFDQLGQQTGYVDYNGQQTTDSRITKRFEDSAGVVFNVRDGYYVTQFPIYYTDNGKITMYFKKSSSTAGSNKVLLDFHHNWKQYDWSASASFNNIGLTGAGYSLNVSYTKANYNWQRVSGGRVL